MKLLPYETETFVVARGWDDILHSLHEATTKSIRFQNQDSGGKSFVGWIKDDRFRISLKISRPNSFLPLVIGQIEPTSTGCIIFVEYTLFPTSKMYLTFWTLFTILIGAILSYQYKNYYLLLISAGVLALIHWISWANFKIQLAKTRERLFTVLS